MDKMTGLSGNTAQIPAAVKAPRLRTREYSYYHPSAVLTVFLEYGARSGSSSVRDGNVNYRPKEKRKSTHPSDRWRHDDKKL